MRTGYFLVTEFNSHHRPPQRWIRKGDPKNSHFEVTWEGLQDDFDVVSLSDPPFRVALLETVTIEQ